MERNTMPNPNWDWASQFVETSSATQGCIHVVKFAIQAHNS
ncbi:hypothetical protein TFLX_02885 [Thermoflexales bacterium]|nr:hypothetical protein TFLX_02885 [Thermoflexales bacterium]